MSAARTNSEAWFGLVWFDLVCCRLASARAFEHGEVGMGKETPHFPPHFTPSAPSYTAASSASPWQRLPGGMPHTASARSTPAASTLAAPTPRVLPDSSTLHTYVHQSKPPHASRTCTQLRGVGVSKSLAAHCPYRAAREAVGKLIS
eukprot:352841-Chlamydomonas_euryale.AAC.6